MSRTDGDRNHSGGNWGGKIAQTRRDLLAITGAGVSIGIAGCSFLQDGNGDGNGNGPLPDPGEIVTGGSLRVGMTGNVNSFDPPYSNDVPSSFGQSLLYESLVVNDSEGNLYPWLADSFELVDLQDVEKADYEPHMIEAPVAEDDEGTRYIDVDEQILVRHPDNDIENEDTAQILTVNEAQDAVDAGVYGMQFRYELHEGITFHNGDEFTSEDVVRTFERYENSMMEAQTFDTFLYADPVDDSTVDLYGQVINAESARELPGVSIIPSAHADLDGGALDPRQGTAPIGTGPYVFEEFENEQYLVLSKNTDYWLEDVGLENKEWWDGPEDFPNSPVLEEVTISIIPDDRTRSVALQNDEIDFTYGLSAGRLDGFDGSADYGVSSVQAGSCDFLQYPMRVEPWDDQRLRRGVNYLIPRTAIVNEIFQGWRDPAWTPLPELVRGAGTADYAALEGTLKPMNELNQEEAVSLIQEVVEERDLETPIEITIETNGDNDDRVRTVELIADSMNQTDLFDVSIQTYEFSAFVARIVDSEYQYRGHIMVNGLSGTFNPDSFCSPINHTRNIGQCCNANGIGWDDLDDMIDRAMEGREVTDDLEKRAELYDQIWETIVERSGTSYINIWSSSAVFNTAVKNFRAYPFSEGMLSYGLYAPHDDQIAWLDREDGE